MAIDWDLAPKVSGKDYLSALQSFDLGRTRVIKDQEFQRAQAVRKGKIDYWGATHLPYGTPPIAGTASAPLASSSPSGIAMEGGTRYAAMAAARAAVRNRLIIAGSVEGGVSGFGAGENWTDRGTGALIGASIGGTLGAAAGTGGQALIEAASGRVAQRTAKLAATAERGGLDEPQAIDAGAIDRSVASMDAEHGGAELYGPEFGATPPPPPGYKLVDEPRVIDRIDVAARPQHLLRDVAEAERAAQGQRIEPRDVLPIPSNTVGSEEEAARIGAGMYQLVKAPNEAEALSSRSIPSQNNGTKTIAKRGPLDLVTWLRSQGGVRAQGGELEHYGIGNTPRAVMDFAGGENRLGPLVTNSGMTYDEAAMRAHEAGFFPDHAERPTVSEFLDTLNATHTGRNRAFRSEDLPEVDAFEAQRALRHSVEGARERGAPLVEDRGQPVDLADLDRNAPPVSAYEEWGENAPKLAGNLRLDKLDSPQAIQRALVTTHARVGGFDAATRGRIAHAETKSLASELGMTVDDLLARREGQAFNAEQALAARQILARSATDLVNMARRVKGVENPGDELEAAFKQAWVRHVAIQEQVAGATAEAGRTLSQFRMTADSRMAARALPSLGDIAGGTGRLKDAADLIVENAGDPTALNIATANALKPKLRHKLVELYYNSLLSGPQTHVVNVLSNTLTALGQFPEHAVAATIGAGRRTVDRNLADRVLFSELGARATGLVQGAKEGIVEAARSFRTGDAADAVTKVEQQSLRAISGVKGDIIRIPTRALTAEDEFFKAVARRMELSGLAVRQAGKEGLRGDAGRKRAAELLANPPEDLLAQSFEYARYMTFQNPLGEVGRHITSITEAMPALKLILPFVRTPTNILKFAIERSPAAPFLKEWRRDIGAGGARRDLAVAKVMTGTGMAALVFQMASEGKITGGGPADDGARKLLLANGWQPYSFKVGAKYYSYQRLDPYSTTLGTAADLVDLQSHMTDKQRENSALLVGTAILHNLSSKTWLSGLSTALDALNDPDRNLESFVSRTSGAIAVPAIIAQMTRSADPILREARSPMDRIRSRIPGLSSSLLPRRDVFGRPIASEGGVGPDIVSPIWTGTDKADPTIKALIEAGAHVAAPSRRVGGRDLTAVEYDRYQVAVGSLLKPKLDTLVAGPGWASIPIDDRKDMIDGVIADTRRSARTEIFGKAPLAGRRNRRTAAGSIPPPPPGFTLAP